ncbi:MAG TPA: biotin/lipoyl-containing protein [Rectinemataceae bacterium]|nr:biotin/lipoyl-containing protein [Rectinemataceae bacterium]
MKRRISLAGTEAEVELLREGEAWTARVGETSLRVERIGEREGELCLRINGRQLQLQWAPDEGGAWICQGGRSYRVEAARKTGPRRRELAGPGEGALRSPMPALVVAIEVAEGEEVEGGRTLIVLEAMKMETKVAAPAGSWKLRRLLVAAGQQIARDQELLELEPRGPSELRLAERRPIGPEGDD